MWQPGLAASPASQHRTALLLGCKLAHPPACGLFNYSFLSSRSLHDLFTISSRSLNERVCQNDNWTNSAKMASCACFVKLTLRACSVKWPLPVCFSAGCPCQQLRRSAPGSDEPRPAEKSTRGWLAVGRIWAGFANSQRRRANFSALIYIDASILIAATLKPLLRQTQICRPICTDCLLHLRISAG